MTGSSNLFSDYNRLRQVGASCLLMWGELSSGCGASCLGASFLWGELSWGELSLGRVVLIPRHDHSCLLSKAVVGCTAGPPTFLAENGFCRTIFGGDYD